jgi:glutamate transport system permease protein
MTTQNQLFDAPGPRGRRRIRIGSAIALLAIVVILVVVAFQLGNSGQLDAAKWSPLVNPADVSFWPLWRILGLGLGRTLIAAVLAIVFSLVLGTLLGVLYLRLGRKSRIPLIGVIEILRGLPLVITIYFVARVLPDAGISFDWAPGGTYLWYLVIGLTIYNSVIIAEIVRAGITALPSGQREAAESLGLSPGQTMRIILLPQAIRIILPVLISQLIIILKDTSLAALVLGRYQELLRAGNLAIQQLNNPIQMFLLIAAIYIVINYLLSRVAEYFERRSWGSKKGQRPDASTKADLEKAAGSLLPD